tara:strand:- start:6219 stop:6614 length:396 start_codon:yes stop_codon:yes gene_type:complete
MSDIGKKIWIFPDAFLPAKGHPYKITKNDDQFGHESLCMLNSSNNDALLNISFYYEDRDPIENYEHTLKAKRSLHLRLDKIVLLNNQKLLTEVPYSIILKSNIKIVAQLSRLDTTSDHNSFMTSLGWGEDN